MANVSRHPSLPRAIRKLLLLKRRAWLRWRLNRTAPNKADFNMASRRCSNEICRYLENQEQLLLGVGSRKFFAYAARRLYPQDNIISLCSASGVPSKPADICSIFRDDSSNFDDFSADITTSSLSCDFSQPALGAPRLSNINIDIVTVRQMLANLRESLLLDQTVSRASFISAWLSGMPLLWLRYISNQYIRLAYQMIGGKRK